MSSTTALDPPHTAAAAGTRRRGELALALQEAFTAAARLRANRQVATDADAFRVQIKQLLGAADQEARRAGYDPAQVKLAIYAYIAFLDESVLNSGQPMFATWPRQPLQEEIFGDHMAGQTFFVHLDDLLARPDSEELADLLEVFLLCLLLGFRGRYGTGEDGGLRGRMLAAQEKIARVRGETGPLSPAAALPSDDVLPSTRDPWLRRLLGVAGATLVASGVLYLVFRLSLGSRLEELRAAAAQLLS